MFSQTAQLYDRFYAWKEYAAEADRLHDLIEARCPAARTLLDVACGTGRHLELLRRWYRVEGVDLDGGLLAVARERVPDVPLHEADMQELDLGRRFDVVTCLFSSIGYVRSATGLGQAVAALGRHVRPGGLLVIEPWLDPEQFAADHIGSVLFVDEPDLKAVRMNGSRLDGRISVLDFHYLVARPGSVEHLTETHRLTLFTNAEYRQALESAGLSAEHDREGLMGRGLWIATKPED